MQAEADVKKADERARAYEEVLAAGAVRRGRPPQGADLVTLARARWQRARDVAAARYGEHEQARARGERRRGRAPVHPDEHGKVRRAWQAYQEALATQDAGADAQDAGAGEVVADTTCGQDRAGAGAAKTDSSSQDQWRANLTDPDSRLLKTRGGWVQGMNCQTSTSEDVFILGARATQDANDLGQFLPTKEAVEARMAQVAERTGRQDLTHIGTMIADAGYDSEANLTAQGPDRLIADSKGRHIEARAATDPTTGPPPAGATARDGAFPFC